MKEALLKLLEVNPGKSFVVAVYSEPEMDDVFEVLEMKEFEPVAPISLEQLRNHALSDIGYPVGLKLNQGNLTVSYQSLEHWKQYTSDIVRFDGDSFAFVE